MDSTDLFLTIIIFFIFTFLYIVNIFYIKYFEIKRNWPVYKCQPMIMPFASFFGHNVGDNFVSCIGNIQGDLMKEFIGPVMSNLDIISSVGGGLTNNIGGLSALGGNMNMNQGFVFDAFGGLLDQFSIVLDKTFSSVGKITENISTTTDALTRIVLNVADIPSSMAKDPFGFLGGS